MVQVVDGALRMGRRREDRPLVFSQDLQPRGNIGGMVFAGLRRDAEVGAEKRRADFGHEFFHGIARIAEAFPAEIPMETRGMTRPVRHFMGEGGVIALRVAEGLKLRHLHQVMGGAVEGHGAAVAHPGAGRRKEALHVLQPGHIPGTGRGVA